MFHRAGGLVAGGRRRVWGVAAGVAAVALGVVGPSGRAAGQGETKGVGQILPAMLQLQWETDDRPADSNTFVATLMAEARTVTILGSALQTHPEIIAQLDPARQRDALRWMSEVVRIEPVPWTDLIKVSCEAPTPKLAATVANAVADSFVKNFVDMRMESLDWRFKMKEQERLEAKHHAASLRRALQDRMRSVGDGYGSPTALVLAADEIREIRKDLRRIRLEKTAAEFRLDRMRKRPKPTEDLELSDAVGVLGAQEEMLVKAEQAGVEGIRRAEVTRLDFEAAQDELSRADERVRAIDEQVQRKKSSIAARWIRNYSRARPAAD